jgi:urease accessory protein
MVNLLNLLQLASPVIPIGAYSYSEGLETLVEQQIITNQQQLQNWLANELNYGSIAIETAIMLRAYDSYVQENYPNLIYWNNWLTASRETTELREQSWQMGTSLLQLLLDLNLPINLTIEGHCNYAIAYAIGAATWDIAKLEATLAYLHSWTTNLIIAGVKLIPLGQTQGQQILHNLRTIIEFNSTRIINLKNEELFTCNWGLSLASLAHQTQYTRLFRS